MNLLFFDIECASVSRTTAKICAFGFVLCNERFKIIKKRDILINPRGQFHLTDRNGNKGIVLPYDYDRFKEYPRFIKVYPYIKSLLEDPNNIVIGHSTINDVKYLNLETKRFQRESFNFEFTDSQLIYMTARNDFTRQYGLEYIAHDLGVQFTPHRAVNDAYATMRVVQAICKEQKCSFPELLKKLNIRNGNISDYKITAPVSQAMQDYEDQIIKEREDRAKTHKKFCGFLSRRHTVKDDKFSGKVFSFSRALEADLEKSEPLVEGIFSHGGIYSQRLSRCNYYIVKDDGDVSPRTKLARGLKNLTVNDMHWLETMIND